MPAANSSRSDKRKRHPDQAPARIRAAQLILAFALLLTAGLIGWRSLEIAGAAVPQSARASTPLALSQPTTAISANTAAAEYALEPFVGPGQVRVIIAGEPASLLVILNSASEPARTLTTDRIAALLSAAGLYVPLAGETLTVQRVPFQSPHAPSPTLAALVEIGALGLIAAALAWSLRSALAGRPNDQGSTVTGHRLSPPATFVEPTAPRRNTENPEAVAHLMRQWLKENAA
ncbi:MAG: hypothetical protein AAGJ32_08725 [Pseudomonadota bacterium]